LSNPSYGPDMRLKHIIDLKSALVKKGFEVRIMTYKTPLRPAQAIIVFNQPPPSPNIGKRLKKYAKKTILILSEPPSVAPESYTSTCHSYFDTVLTMADSLIDNKKYFKFYYPFPSFEQKNNLVRFKHKKFCLSIATNRTSDHPHELYSARLDTI